MKHLILGLGGIGGNIVRLVREKAPDHVYALLDSDIENCEQWQAEGIPCVHLGSPHNFRTLTQMAANLQPEQWFPQDPFLLSQQADFSCGHRVAGRLLFEIALEQGRMRTVTRLLDELLHGPAVMGVPDITIVTTLSGGTGSGCMLPLTLWLRKTLRERYNINPQIRGVFLLPEAVTQALGFLPANRTDYLYCNAAAALKELDAIEGIFAGTRTFPPFSMGELFDSTRDYGTGNHVFDHCYVVGEYAHCRNLDAVMKHAADAVYALSSLQCTRSMENSVLFTPYLQYKAIGVGTAGYPSDYLRKYCVTKLMRSMFDDPWYYLDEEVARRKAEAPVKLQHEDVYRAVFREKAMAMPDALPALQVCDEDAMAYSGQPSEKIAQLLRRVAAVAKETTEKMFPLELPEPVKWSALSREALEDMLRCAVSSLHTAVSSLDNQARELAERIAEELLPYYSPIPFDGAGILLSHRGDSVHPAAARYLIYEICDRMQQQLQTMEPEQLAQQLLHTLTYDEQFDNPATTAKEGTLQELLERKPLFVSADKHLIACQDRLQAVFRKLQQQFDTFKQCTLLSNLYEVLIEHFRALAGNYEAIFHSAPEIRGRLTEVLEAEPDIPPATYWFCSEPEAVEDIYQQVKARFHFPMGALHDQLRILVEKHYLHQGIGMIGMYPTASDVIQALTGHFCTALDVQCGDLLNPDLSAALQLHHRRDGTALAPTAAWLAECADILMPLAAPARISDNTDFSEHAITFMALNPGYPMDLLPPQPPFSSEACVAKDALMRVDIQCGILTYDLLHGRGYPLAHYMQLLKPLLEGQAITPHLDAGWHKIL